MFAFYSAWSESSTKNKNQLTRNPKIDKLSVSYAVCVQRAMHACHRQRRQLFPVSIRCQSSEFLSPIMVDNNWLVCVFVHPHAMQCFDFMATELASTIARIFHTQSMHWIHTFVQIHVNAYFVEQKIGANAEQGEDNAPHGNNGASHKITSSKIIANAFFVSHFTNINSFICRCN